MTDRQGNDDDRSSSSSSSLSPSIRLAPEHSARGHRPSASMSSDVVPSSFKSSPNAPWSHVELSPEPGMTDASSPSLTSSVAAVAPTPSASTTATRHSHARSRSVNLSPTLQTGTAFTPGAIKWDPYGSEVKRSASSNAHLPSASSPLLASHYHTTMGHASAASNTPSSMHASGGPSTHLRPTSPIYVSVHGLGLASSGTESSSSRSPLYAGSEGGSSSGSGSEPSTSPDTRRSSHLIARVMERSHSGGGSGSSSIGASPLSPRSPRGETMRRTASPSRAFAVPISPRLQALGAGGHGRKLSGSALRDPIARTPSPLLGTSASKSALERPESPRGRGANEAELPVDSIWPNVQSDGNHPATANGVEVIPVASSSSFSTPVPPSLRDEMAAQSSSSVTAVPIHGLSHSPGMRMASPNPEWSSNASRIQRTPSPLEWQHMSRRKSQSPSPSSLPLASSPLRSSSPALSAPQPIAKNALNLASVAMRRHSRALSNSSNESDNSDRRDPLAVPEASGAPTYKAISQPRALQTKLDGATAHAELGGILARDVEENQASVSTSPVDDRTSVSARASGSPHQRFRLLERRPSFEVSSPLQSPRTILSSSRESGPEMFGGLRAQSPALRTASPAGSIGESPPKVRSFIGMPPRSGYELSDDPDDVGSEDGSIGSGRDSVGTNEDRDDDEMEDVDGDTDEDAVNRTGEDADEGNGEAVKVKSLDDVSLDTEGEEMRVEPRPGVPKRPSLTQEAVVATALSSDQTASPFWGEGNDAEETDSDMTEQQEGVGGDAEIASGEDMQGDLLQEESLTTLERIFLFAKSEMTYHRVLVSHSLADWMVEVELSEAVEYVIPLLNGLACDVNEVCIAFAPQLHRVMWYFFRNCPLSDDDQHVDRNSMHEESASSEAQATRPRLSVATFTPLLCALLLNSNAQIATATQSSIVFFFARLQGLTLAGDMFDLYDDEDDVKVQQTGPPGHRLQERQPFDNDTTLVTDAATREETRVALERYDFGEAARQRVANELLNHVALAIGHLSGDQTQEADLDQDVPPLEEESQEYTNLSTPVRYDDEQAMSEHVSQDDLSTSISNDDAGSSEGAQKNNSIETDVVVEADVRDNMHDAANAERAVSADVARTESDQESEPTDSATLPWEQDELDGLGDTAMASLDGASVTMSIEEEVAVGRMASISLLAALGTEEFLSSEFLRDHVVPELVASSEHRTFFVRKEAAVAIGSLARVIGHERLQECDMLSVFERLCRDKIWHVRQAACLSMPNFFVQLTDRSVRRSRLLDVMGVFVSDVSRNVRVAALDIIGEIIYLFHDDPEGVPPPLVRHFLGKPWTATDEEEERNEDLTNANSNAERGQSEPHANAMGWGSSSYNSEAFENGANASQSVFGSDPDRPLVMAYNLPAITLTLGAEQWPLLRSVHAQLCNHLSPKVRRSLAASLHEVAKIIGANAATTDLLPFLVHFLDPRYEQEADVKLALLENVEVLLAHVRLESGVDALKTLFDLWNDEEPFGTGARFPNNWRMRHKLIAKLPKLAARFLLEDDQGILVLLMQAALLDAVSAIRVEGITSVSTMYQLFAEHDQVLADGFLGMLVDLCDGQPGYRARVATLQALFDLCKGPIQRASIEMLAMPRLVELSRDDVVDVRLALASLVALMCQLNELYALPQSRSDDLTGIIRRLGNDEAPIVRATIGSVISDDELTGLGPPSPMLDRPRRELVLGPVGGGPHRSYHTMDDVSDEGESERRGENEGVMEDNEGEDATLFAMDDEERSSPQSADGHDETSKRRPAPSLANSALARRRIKNSHTLTSEAESGHEFARGDLSFRTSNLDGKPNGQTMHDDDDDDDDTIEIPSEENALLLHARHTSASSFNNHVDDDDDDTPHHLLGIAADAHQTTTERQDDGQVSNGQDQMSLESPERPFHSASTNHLTKDASTHLLEMKRNGVPVQGGRDPFLAFVADQYFDRTGPEQTTKTSRSDDLVARKTTATEAPFSPEQQQSTFEDDDEEDEQGRTVDDGSSFAD